MVLDLLSGGGDGFDDVAEISSGNLAAECPYRGLDQYRKPVDVWRSACIEQTSRKAESATKQTNQKIRSAGYAI